MKEKKESKIYPRIIVSIVGMLLLIIIIYNFFVAENGSITTGLISILILLIVVALSESFDNFSVLNLLSMSRKLKKQENSVVKLTTENDKLRENLISITTTMSQQQSSTNILGFPDYLFKKFDVEQATEDEVNENQNEDPSRAIEEPTRRKRIDFHKVSTVAIDRFIKQNKLEHYQLIKEAKLVSIFDGIDPISDYHPIFDAYIKTFEAELFIETKSATNNTFMLRDRIYSMLNKLYYYNKISKTNVVFILLLLDPDRKQQNNIRVYDTERTIQRLEEFFAPAINSGLLRIVHMKFDEEESKEFYN